MQYILSASVHIRLNESNRYYVRVEQLFQFLREWFKNISVVHSLAGEKILNECFASIYCASFCLSFI